MEHTKIVIHNYTKLSDEKVLERAKVALEEARLSSEFTCFPDGTIIAKVKREAGWSLNVQGGYRKFGGE